MDKVYVDYYLFAFVKPDYNIKPKHIVTLMDSVFGNNERFHTTSFEVYSYISNDIIDYIKKIDDRNGWYDRTNALFYFTKDYYENVRDLKNDSIKFTLYTPFIAILCKETKPIMKHAKLVKVKTERSFNDVSISKSRILTKTKVNEPGILDRLTADDNVDAYLTGLNYAGGQAPCFYFNPIEKTGRVNFCLHGGMASKEMRDFNGPVTAEIRKMINEYTGEVEVMFCDYEVMFSHGSACHKIFLIFTDDCIRLKNCRDIEELYYVSLMIELERDKSNIDDCMDIIYRITGNSTEKISTKIVK